jgi:hypothetical protein
MATSELLENAVKYGDIMHGVEISVEYNSAAGCVTVEVSNYAQPARIRVLEREFASCAGESATDAFTRAVGRLQRLPQGTTMLGLARLSSEATLHLDVQGLRVTVSALVEKSPPAQSGVPARFTARQKIAGGIR